jgi:single-strand DNA-binding protein
MSPSNLVVLRGHITSDPVARSLPSGTFVTQVELTTRVADAATSVPVVVEGRSVTAAAGDEVVVAGHVRRRFFRAGGVTQSRTEVVAASIVPANRRRSVDKLIAGVTAQIGQM